MIPRFATTAALILAIATTAAAALEARVPPPAGRQGLTPAEQRGKALAQRRCSACHAVVRNGVSPNPEAPSFDHIANMAGLAPPTLRQFLRDSHNFPAVMNFRLEDEQVDDLAEYVVTLQRPDYRPVM